MRAEGNEYLESFSLLQLSIHAEDLEYVLGR